MSRPPAEDDDTARRVRQRVDSEGAQETPTGAQLGLQFSSGPSTESRPALSFFEGHVSMRVSTDTASAEGRAAMPRSSNLTDVLPTSCHVAFETALDFIYSEEKESFEVPTSEAVLLLKIAEVLGARKLFEAAACKIKAAFREAAPLFLKQHLSFHIPGTDEGMAMRSLVQKAKAMLLERFEPFLECQEMREAMLALPCGELTTILEAQDLRVSHEDVVCQFVLQRLGDDVTREDAPSTLQNEEASLLGKVQWAHISSEVMGKVLVVKRLFPFVCMSAMLDLTLERDLRFKAVHKPRRQIMPPGIAPPGSLDVDFTFLYRAGKFKRGEHLRSQPKRMGDLVVCLLLFPAGTTHDESKDFMSLFLEAVPQPGWPQNWAFPDVSYSLSCLRWQGGGNLVKHDTWTCKAATIDRGSRSFLPLQEVDRYTSPDGFLCIRGSVHRDTQLFLP